MADHIKPGDRVIVIGYCCNPQNLGRVFTVKKIKFAEYLNCDICKRPRRNLGVVNHPDFADDMWLLQKHVRKLPPITKEDEQFVASLAPTPDEILAGVDNALTSFWGKL